MARLGFFFLSFSAVYSGNVRSHQLLCLVPLFTIITTLDQRDTKLISVATRPNHANVGNRTQAASAASKSPIHYTIASPLKWPKISWHQFFWGNKSNLILISMYFLDIYLPAQLSYLNQGKLHFHLSVWTPNNFRCKNIQFLPSTLDLRRKIVFRKSWDWTQALLLHRQIFNHQNITLRATF